MFGLPGAKSLDICQSNQHYCSSIVTILLPRSHSYPTLCTNQISFITKTILSYAVILEDYYYSASQDVVVLVDVERLHKNLIVHV